MVFFFYGADSYRIRQKVNSVIEEYQAKHKSGLNFGRFDLSGDEAFARTKDFLNVYSMFAEKKLAIVDNLFSAVKDEQERFLEYLQNSDILKTQESFLVIAQELALNEDKKVKQKYVLKNSQELFKMLTGKVKADVSAGVPHSGTKAEEFDYLSGAKLENWVKKQAQCAGAPIDDKAVRKLALFVGADLWRMKNEIAKLAAYANGKIIDERMADELVGAKIDNDIFKTIDALAGRNKQAALNLLHRHLAEGQSEMYLLSMLVYQFRNLLLVKSEIERGAQFQALSQNIKLHPFVLRKSFEQGRGFSLPVLKKIYERLLDLDIAIKTGRVDSQTALDLVVGEITS